MAMWVATRSIGWTRLGLFAATDYAAAQEVSDETRESVKQGEAVIFLYQLQQQQIAWWALLYRLISLVLIPCLMMQGECGPVPQPNPNPDPPPDPHPDPQPDPKPEGGGGGGGEDTDEPDDPDDGYDLAFGVGEHLISFASSFDKTTLMFLDWPDEIIMDDEGNLLRLNQGWVLRAHFHEILTAYFQQVPNGRLKFNLFGLESGVRVGGREPVTVWELREINNVYRSRADFYLYDSSIPLKQALDDANANLLIAEILQGY